MTDVGTSADHRHSGLTHYDFSEVIHSVPSLFSAFLKHEELNIDTRKTLHSLYSFEGPGRRTSVQPSIVQGLCECDPDLQDSDIISVHKDMAMALQSTSPNSYMPKLKHMNSVQVFDFQMRVLTLRELGTRRQAFSWQIQDLAIIHWCGFEDPRCPRNAPLSRFSLQHFLSRSKDPCCLLQKRASETMTTCYSKLPPTSCPFL